MPNDSLARRMVGTAGSIFACAAAPTLIASVSVCFLNGLSLWDATVVTLWLWPVFACVLAGPLLLTVLLVRLARRPCTWDHLAGVTLSALFAGLWIARLEPAHQLLTRRPHMSNAGIIELVVVAAVSSAILVAVWRLRSGTRLRTVSLLLILGTVAISAIARGLEPTRDRSRFVTRLPAAHANQSRVQDPPPRVLIIGIDGLDWRAIEGLVRAGQLPAIEALLDRGRFYQLDNRQMAVSPQIWTALYTGYPESANSVGGFSEWQFVGASRPVAFVPRFGVHGIWMLDELLKKLDLIGGWREQEVTTMRIVKPPVWSIASSSGRRVAVIDPVPFLVIGERVNGLFAWPSGDWYTVSRRASFDAPTTIVVEPLPIKDSSFPASDDFDERARVDLTMRYFADVQPDLGVYYTHFVDSIAHNNWDFRFSDSWFGGDPRAELASNFDATTIANAYRQADAHVRDLVASFGPGTVILVSDHGWEFNEYKHFLSPHGVLIVANTGATGYGGVVDVLSVAPTILSLLRLPIANDMQAPIAEVTAALGATSAYDGVRQDFVIDDRLVVDPDLRRLLKSLGYLSGQ